MFEEKLPDPPELLTYIQHGCKEDGCESSNCSCRKYGEKFSYVYISYCVKSSQKNLVEI